MSAGPLNTTSRWEQSERKQRKTILRLWESPSRVSQQLAMGKSSRSVRSTTKIAGKKIVTIDLW